MVNVIELFDVKNFRVKFPPKPKNYPVQESLKSVTTQVTIGKKYQYFKIFELFQSVFNFGDIQTLKLSHKKSFILLSTAAVRDQQRQKVAFPNRMQCQKYKSTDKNNLSPVSRF